MSLLTIAFEGIPGAGKSTAIEGVSAHFRAQEMAVHVIGHGGSLELKLKELILSQPIDMDPVERLFFYGCRLASKTHFAQSIAGSLENGILLFDRFTTSLNVMGHHVDGLPRHHVAHFTRAAARNFHPDALILFDVDDEGHRERCGTLAPGLLQKYRRGFHKEFAEFDGPRLLIDSTARPPDECRDKVISFLAERVDL